MASVFLVTRAGDGTQHRSLLKSLSMQRGNCLMKPRSAAHLVICALSLWRLCVLLRPVLVVTVFVRLVPCGQLHTPTVPCSEPGCKRGLKHSADYSAANIQFFTVKLQAELSRQLLPQTGNSSYVGTAIYMLVQPELVWFQAFGRKGTAADSSGKYTPSWSRYSTNASGSSISRVRYVTRSKLLCQLEIWQFRIALSSMQRPRLDGSACALASCQGFLFQPMYFWIDVQGSLAFQ